MKSLIVKRKANSHKGDYGRVGVIGGSTGFTGAPYLTSLASLRTGSGYVFTFIPRTLESVMSIKLTEAIIRPIEDKNTGHFTMESLQDIFKYIKELDVLAVGPGMGVDADRTYLVKEIIKNSDIPIVLDADGLNCISNESHILKANRTPIIVTPHPGELARFLGIEIKKLQERRVYYSEITAKEYNVVVVLKGNKTVVASPKEGIYINDTGNPGMATAGSGDVLTGMVASFLGQGIDPFPAAKLGVHLHGMAGDISRDRLGEYGMIASDIIHDIPGAIKKYGFNK